MKLFYYHKNRYFKNIFNKLKVISNFQRIFINIDKLKKILYPGGIFYMTEFNSIQLRNLALVGHGKSGKTLIAENCLFKSGGC